MEICLRQEDEPGGGAGSVDPMAAQGSHWDRVGGLLSLPAWEMHRN